MKVKELTELSRVRTLNYDANGNLTNDGNGKVYAYDAANRLISVTQGSTVTGYAYDGNGHRVRETSNGTVVKQWVWGMGTELPAEERDGSNNVTKRFYDEGEILLTGANAGSYFFTTDILGSIREMTNSAGGLVARYDYDPFGRRTLVSGTDLADFSFTGFYYDQATGLDFSVSRPYAADLARWLSRDPIGEDGGINLYAYVGNNPTNWTDPWGLDAPPGAPPPAPAPGGPPPGVPTPPTKIPGGPWTWSPDGPGGTNPRGGDFMGPPQPSGPRDKLTIVATSSGGQAMPML